MLINSSAGCFLGGIMILCSILKFYGGQIGGVVNIAPSSAKLSINIQNSIGGSRMITLTLQDHIFQVA